MTSSNIKRVIVADDHPVVLHGVEALLNAESDFQVVATCQDGLEALEVIRKHVPDIAVLDISMPGLSGLEVLAHVVQDALATKIIFLTAIANDRHILAAITRRAHGFLLKDSASDALVDCLRAVAAGRRWIPTEVIQAALGRESQRLAELKLILHALSPREHEVVDLVASGLSNKEVAQQLSITESTVKIHLNKIYRKAGVHNRTTLAALALRLEQHQN